MKILCKIKRRGGSHVEVPGGETKTYHFAPNASDDHVADVEDPAHIKVLLGIDCYEVYEGQAPVEPVEPVSDEPEAEPSEKGGELKAALEQMTLEELQAEYHHVFGKAAHPQSKHSTLVAKLLLGAKVLDATRPAGSAE